jgi:molecular chaperone HscC
MSDTKSICVGIDLGTTNSLVAIFQNGKPELIPNPFQKFLTPSVVGILPSGEVLVGQPAVELRITHPERTASCFKRYMGTDRSIGIAGKKFTAQELSSLVLKSLARDAEAYLNQSITDAVITVPAYFNEHQRKATQMAGEMAGLNVRRIVNEPTAAALVYGFNAPQVEKKLCVIDLGGGTFDVTVMDVFEGTLEIKATAGQSMLGGEDFTDRIVSAVLKQMNMQMEAAEIKAPKLVARLRHECNNAKVTLTNNEESTIRIPNSGGVIGEQAQLVKVQRSTFAKLCEPLMQRIREPISRALRDAELSPNEIDDVILVGGATRMPILRETVQNLFSKQGRIEFNPDEVVALGASIQAALILQDAAVEDLVMTDVCPFTLGVEVCKEFGGRIAEGYFQPIIHRNSTIPISKEEQFSTICPNQDKVEIRIYQGDSRRVADNVELGLLSVEGIPPGPAGSPFYIRFSYDLNGVLEVEAYAPGGRKHRSVLTNHVRGLSPQQVQIAINRLQQLKFYPREDMRHQNLARYCERLMGEVNQHQRAELDQILDGYENALAQGDREIAEKARENIILALSYMGFHYSDDGENE